MEASFQAYRGRVNYVWVYGSEAHPEEHPFTDGFECTDLGWTHPYSITTTMEDRAQRARWLKTDPEPDFEIPMMIDYINDPPHTNNLIRSTYLGGGFYSGYVIDCDGKVLVREPWGWFAPGGEWWGLPLAPVDRLHTFLDTYLADPPECYSTGSDDADSAPDAPVDAPPDLPADDPVEDVEPEEEAPPPETGSCGCSIVS